ncbi:protein FAM184B [Amia ocellicauda]|uniref:protein FAM184B n=1 Tax=Amia ocellicauda TaxID=2972642 RepID=UPI0034645FE9
MASGSSKAASQPPPPPVGAPCNGTAAAEPPGTVEQELYDYQMHTKMCKKIAQLTKVIYSLNTKSEEHEAELQGLHEAHSEELQRLVEENREAAQRHQSHLGEETAELRQRLQAAEEALGRQERLGAEAKAELEALHWETEEQARRAEAEQGERVVALVQEVQELKRELEDKARGLSELAQDREDAEAELRGIRQRCQGLQEECIELHRSSQDERERLEEVCQARTQALSEEVEALRAQRASWAEESDRAVRGLRDAHRQDLESLERTLQQSLADALAQRQQQEQERRKALQGALQQKLKRAEGELEVRDRQLGECKRQALKMQERTQDLERQLEDARRRAADAVATMRKSEEELSVAKERLILQENELLNKSEELQTQTSSQSKASAEVEDLRSRAVQLQKRVRELEQRVGGGGGGGKTGDHAQQVRQHVEALSAQKQDLQRSHVEELRRLKRQADEEKTSLKEQLMKGLEEVMKRHAAELKAVQGSLEAERKKIQKDLQTQVEEFKRKMEIERMQLEKEKEELSRRLQESATEVSRLEALVRHGESSTGRGERTAEALEEALGTIAALTEELGQQKQKHCAELSALKKTMEEQEKAGSQADVNCGDKIRLECERLCEGLRTERAGWELSPLGRVQRDKEAELKEINERWQKRLREPQTQLEGQPLECGKDRGHKEEVLSEDRDRDSRKQELEETGKANQSRSLQLESAHPGKQNNSENQEAEERKLRPRDEALRAERHAHQLALRALQERAQEELQAERQRQQAQQKSLLERQKAELTQQHAGWCRQLAQRHMKQIEELQGELKTHTELMALQQDFKQQSQVQAFARQLEETRGELSALRKENAELTEQLDSLSSALELKTQEVQRLQDSEQQQRRSWEEEVLARHCLEAECVNREHRQEIHTIVSDFSSAQTRLQARIAALEAELKEKEEKSKRRESRMEDLHIIGKLQDKLSEREHVIKRLLEERRCHPPAQGTSDAAAVKCYENRPLPGSLTPTLKKKRMEEMPPRVTSVPNLSSYERSFLGCEGAPGARSPQATKSPSFEHGRCVSRMSNPPTPAADPNPGMRSPAEPKFLQQGAEAPDPQRQEWFTKYFSF